MVEVKAGVTVHVTSGRRTGQDRSTPIPAPGLPSTWESHPLKGVHTDTYAAPTVFRAPGSCIRGRLPQAQRLPGLFTIAAEKTEAQNGQGPELAQPGSGHAAAHEDPPRAEDVPSLWDPRAHTPRSPAHLLCSSLPPPQPRGPLHHTRLHPAARAQPGPLPPAPGHWLCFICGETEALRGHI